jgi:hypothetical protein
MFDLKQAIKEWRRQMLAGGIKTPELLDELESHLREDVERQMRTGKGVEQAFELAIQQFGHPQALNEEFAKIDGIKKSHRSKRQLWVSIPLAGVLPAGAYALLKYEMTLSWRLLGLGDLAVIASCILFSRYINRLFPVIPQKRVRTGVGLSSGLAGMVGIIVFMNFFLPMFALTEGQLAVAALWAVTVMAALGAVWAGLEDAADRETTVAGS